MDLSWFQPLLDEVGRTRLAPWDQALGEVVRQRLHGPRHGDLPRWETALDMLPPLPPGRVCLDRACVGVDPFRPLPAAETRRLRAALGALHPWRKGPYCLHGVRVDAEWRSDLKWDRLASTITPLTGRLVLDVGCGNGYHAWRMIGAGARLVVGIDPAPLFVAQFRAINNSVGSDRVGVLPLGIEHLPRGLTGFDTLFSMGVLYHRRSPLRHLISLRRLLRPGGELVLETLVLDVDGPQILMPKGRYAGMRNVWCIPSPALLADWLVRCGFEGARLIDLTATSVAEQDRTEWMRFQSLRHQLDPRDPGRTREGLPAPVRAILLARRPG